MKLLSIFCFWRWEQIKVASTYIFLYLYRLIINYNIYQSLILILLENIWLKVNIESIYMAVGVVYRPQCIDYINFIDNFETSVSKIIPLVDVILCLGDFNTDLLYYNNKAA